MRMILQGGGLVSGSGGHCRGTQDSCRGGVSGTTVGPAFDSGGSITFASAMMASECLRRCSGVGDGADNGY